MLNFEDFEFVAEAKNHKIRGTTNEKKCVVFTDICKSSELWATEESTMFAAILFAIELQSKPSDKKAQRNR